MLNKHIIIIINLGINNTIPKSQKVFILPINFLFDTDTTFVTFNKI